MNNNTKFNFKTFLDIVGSAIDIFTFFTDINMYDSNNIKYNNPLESTIKRVKKIEQEKEETNTKLNKDYEIAKNNQSIINKDHGFNEFF